MLCVFSCFYYRLLVINNNSFLNISFKYNKNLYERLLVNLYKLIIEYAPISNDSNEKIKELYMENITTTTKVN